MEPLRELFDRIPPLVDEAVAGLSLDQLTRLPAPGTNPIAWLVWHLTRIEDDHVAEVADGDQVWVTGAWAPRFGLAGDRTDTGYGHSPEEVASIRPGRPEDLLEYHGAVADRTAAFLADLDPGDLDRVVDDSWDPPVTLGVRLVSVASDALQHLGQAAYVRGLLGFD